MTEAQIAHLIGKQLEGVTLDGDQRLSMNFSDGTTLVVGIRSGKLTVDVHRGSAPTPSTAEAPTRRQLEYLLFIAQYMLRFGRAPAESDIERHFLVSAPSVNQMMQTLERRGFIARQPRVPRSTKICIDLAPFGGD